MKKKILSLLAAFFMLFGTSAMAQVDSTLEGDVNGDGVVDIADIAAVIAIIKQNAEANPTYYWYVGQTMPDSVDTLTWKSSTKDAGFTETVDVLVGDTYLVIPNDWSIRQKILQVMILHLMHLLNLQIKQKLMDM